jgi:hypothetical protein
MQQCRSRCRRIASDAASGGWTEANASRADAASLSASATETATVGPNHRSAAATRAVSKTIRAAETTAAAVSAALA